MASSDERGIALVTVIFIGAAMTAVASVASFATIREFQSGRDDRRAAGAHAYAEAGIDRFIDFMKNGNITYNHLYSAGCPSTSGGVARPKLALPVVNNAIGRGRFSAFLEVSDRSGRVLTPASCAGRPEDANDPLYVAITSTGRYPASTRVLRQVLKVQAAGLPVGHYAENVSGGGNPGMTGVSLVSETNITGRDQIAFKGLDPYYRLSHFYPNVPESFWTAQGKSSKDHIPAAAHAAGTMWLKSNASGAEFAAGTRNCTANNTGGNSPGTVHQSLWDGDGSTGSGQITSGCGVYPSTTLQQGYPPTSKFDQAALANVAPSEVSEQTHNFLRQAAQSNGLYCRISSTAQACTRRGVSIPYTGVWQPADITNPMDAAGVKNFIAYFDFLDGTELGNSVSWKSGWGPCSDDPAINKSLTIVVRRGSISVEGQININGALIADGAFKYTGGPTINGTIIAKEFSLNGGATFSLDACWVRNMPGSFLGFEPVHWSEIDR